MFSKDARPNTYVNDVQVDIICKKVADKYGLEGKPKIAYGVATFLPSNTTATIDYTDAGFSSPPVVVGNVCTDSTQNISSDRNRIAVTSNVTSTSARFVRHNAGSTYDLPFYWMAIGN